MRKLRIAPHFLEYKVSQLEFKPTGIDSRICALNHVSTQWAPRCYEHPFPWHTVGPLTQHSVLLYMDRNFVSWYPEWYSKPCERTSSLTGNMHPWKQRLKWVSSSCGLQHNLHLFPVAPHSQFTMRTISPLKKCSGRWLKIMLPLYNVPLLISVKWIKMLP